MQSVQQEENRERRSENREPLDIANAQSRNCAWTPGGRQA